MTNKNFNEIFSYWGEKERAISQRPVGGFNRKRKPVAASPTIPVDEASNSLNINENKSESTSPDNNQPIATTTTTSESTSYNNQPIATTTTTTAYNQPTTTSTTAYDNQSISEEQNKNSYENLTQSSSSKTNIRVSYENVSSDFEQTTTTSRSNYENATHLLLSSDNGSTTALRDSNINQCYSEPSNYNASQYSESSGPNGSGYSQYNGGGGGSSNYNISNYGGGSSGYSVYNDKSTTYNPDDEDYEEDEDDEDDSNDVEKKKRPYIERDISESDLLLLETLIRDKARLGSVDESDIDGEKSLGTLESPYSEEENNFQSNPYISSHVAFTSSYSHPKFLTDKGISDVPGSSNRSLDTSSASSIGKKLDNVSLTSWNEEFQRLLEMDDCLEKYERLSSLEHDFVYAAETYGRIIISENFLANDLKTIKPVSVGGIAGGEKYIVQGILFKFALENETFGLYGSDENAMKTAAHELNGCTSFLNCGIKGLHVPLMAFIDYRGFRLMAMSLLPISKKSLIYGSCDAGQTVHTSNTIFNHLFSNAAKVVNLKSHFVQDISGDIKSICGPIDIEGHIGTDNRFYLLDFARLSPPEPPKHRGSYLYKLLRLELVRKYTTPLCSDSFSPMARIDVDVHNSEVQDAYDDLIQNIIPNFANTFQEAIIYNNDVQNISDDSLSSIFFKHKDISKQLHSEGINVRYLGEVASHMRGFSFRCFLVIEAIVRTLKSLARELLRREMKKTHLPSDYPYRNLLLNFLNLIFDEFKGKTELFWSKIVIEKMEKKFENIFLNRHRKDVVEDDEPGLQSNLGKRDNSISVVIKYEENPSSLDNLTGVDLIKFLLQYKVSRSKILSKFCKSIGVVLSKVAKSQFEKSQTSFVFVDPDIKEIKTLITRLNIIDFADGMSLYYKSMAHGLNDSSKNRLLTISKDRLEASLHSMSTNYNAILHLANVIRLISKYNGSSHYYSSKEQLNSANKMLIQLENSRIDQNLLLYARIVRIKIALALTAVETLTPEQNSEFEKLIKDCIELSPSKAYPTYLLAKYYYSKSKGNRDSDYSNILDAYNNIFLIDPNYQKGHIGVSIFLLNTQSYHNLFNTETVSEHITKAFSIGNIESIVNKIKPLIDFNPWVVFESSRSIPKVRSMVKTALEAKVQERKNKILLPLEISYTEEDSFYFSNIQLEKLYFTKQTNSTNVQVFSKIQPNLSSIVLTKTAFDQPLLVFNSLNHYNNLVSINFGGSSNITDDLLSLVIKPTLKKIKLFDIDTISDTTTLTIANTCFNLEVLDLGGCKAISGINFGAVYKGCPMLSKLALPPFASNSDLNEALVSLNCLTRIDLMGCENISQETYVKAFTVCGGLKKLRTPEGIPMFYLEQQNLISRFTKLNTFEPALRFNLNGIELLQVKIGYGQIINQGRIFEFFLNNNHPMVRFRDPPNPKAGFFKVFHVNIVDKPITRMSIFKDPGNSGYWKTIDFASTLHISTTAISQFRFDYLFSQYSFRLFVQPTPSGVTFSNQVCIDGSNQYLLHVSNTKSMRQSVDIEIKSRISIIPILLSIATGFQN